MNYIKSYNEYLNEGLFNNLLNFAKNKISMNYSKIFGSASIVNKLINSYKEEVLKLQLKKNKVLKEYANYIGSEVKSEETLNKLKNNFNKASDNFDKELKILKDKFDIKFNEIVDNEKNDKIKNFILLKKLELQQELLQNETKVILTDAELTDKEIQSDEFLKKILQSIKEKTDDNIKKQKEQKDILDKVEKLDFDIDKAKKMSREGKTYLWENSPMADYEFLKDDEISFFSNANKEETKATVIEDLGNKIKIKTERGNIIEINKKSVIKSKNFK